MNDTAKSLKNGFTFARIEERVNSPHAVYPRIIYEKDGKEYYFDASSFCFNLQELKDKP